MAGQVAGFDEMGVFVTIPTRDLEIPPLGYLPPPIAALYI